MVKFWFGFFDGVDVWLQLIRRISTIRNAAVPSITMLYSCAETNFLRVDKEFVVFQPLVDFVLVKWVRFVSLFLDRRRTRILYECIHCPFSLTAVWAWRNVG